MGTHRLTWTRQQVGDTWWGTPPGKWRVAEVVHRTVHQDGGSYKPLLDEWWLAVFLHEEVGRFDTADEAMRYLDSLWDEHAARRRL